MTKIIDTKKYCVQYCRYCTECGAFIRSLLVPTIYIIYDIIYTLSYTVLVLYYS